MKGMLYATSAELCHDVVVNLTLVAVATLIPRLYIWALLVGSLGLTGLFAQRRSELGA